MGKTRSKDLVSIAGFPFTAFAYRWRYFSLKKNIWVEKLISTFLSSSERLSKAKKVWSSIILVLGIYSGLSSLRPGKAVGRPFCENFLILVECPRDSRKKSDWFRCKKISQELKYLNFKCEQSERYFFVLFCSFYHSAHVPCEKFRWRQAKSASGNQLITNWGVSRDLYNSFRCFHGLNSSRQFSKLGFLKPEPFTGKVVFSPWYGEIIKYVWGFYGANMVNLINRMVSMKILWRLYGDNVESYTYNRDFMVKLVRR